MADSEKDPLNDTVDAVSEALTLTADPTKLVAKRTAKAYLKTILAGATKGTVTAAMAVGAGTGAAQEPPTISPDRGAIRPEEHQGAESQDANTLGQAGEYYVSSTGDLHNFAVVKDGSKLYFTIPPKRKN